MKKKLLVGIVVVMTLLGLVACGSDNNTSVIKNNDDNNIVNTEETKVDTLETLMASEIEAINSELKQTQESQAAVYNEISFKVVGNDCVYVYTCAEGIMLDPSKLEVLEESTYKPAAVSLFDALYSEYSIYPESVTFNFVESDGTTEIFSYAYSKADYEAEH